MNKKRIYFVPHQDDELLTMGIDISSSILKGCEVHVVLCTDGSKSSVRVRLNDGKKCNKHEGVHCYELSVKEFIQARDKEFIDSCLALGVKKENIHIPEKRDIDGALMFSNSEKLIKDFLSKVGEDALVCTISPNNGAKQHKDHKTIGKVAERLMNTGVIRQVKFFVEPYHYVQIQENPRLIPFEPDIVLAEGKVKERVMNAMKSYQYWNPDEGRYAVGYHSVTTEFNDFLKEMKSCSYIRRNPKMMTFFEKLDEQHRKWKKIQKQKQYYYSLSTCKKPDLQDLKLIHVKEFDVENYKKVIESLNENLREKDIERIETGSSFWCLTNEENVMVSSGWLAYQQKFYIGEMDYGFDMSDSDSAILFDFNTKMDYRGKGYYGLLLRSIVTCAEKPEKFIIYTSLDNESSYKGILKAGFKEDGVLTSLDGSMKEYLLKQGFTSLWRKYRYQGLIVK